MKIKRCLYCYKELSESDIDYHPKCSKSFYGKLSPPKLEFTDDDIIKMAEQVLKNQQTVTGVQPKLSLKLEEDNTDSHSDRITIVGGLVGNYILKPQSSVYKNLPELEDLTMHLARISKIKTVDHSLIRLQSGKLAYITKRIDRKEEEKLHMEDMCQLTERLTENKYSGSHEQIGKVILKHTANPLFDIINFYELVIFSFITGNSDMHLKNFSLLKDENLNYNLCPAYDLVATKLLLETDKEELALTLNGKKRKLKRRDFESAMKTSKLETKQIENLFKKFKKIIPKWDKFIDISFIPNDLKEKYKEIIINNCNQIDINIAFSK